MTKRRRPRTNTGATQSDSARRLKPTLTPDPRLTPPWEPSQWLRSAIASRVEHVDRVLHAASALGVDVAQRLTLVQLKPSTDGTPSDRTCDRCGVYVHPTGDYAIEAISPPGRTDLRIIVGLCRRCAAREGWRS